MLLATSFLLIAAIISAGVGIYQVNFEKKTFELEIRPYIIIEDIQLLSYNKTTSYREYDFQIRNIGKLPALYMNPQISGVYIQKSLELKEKNNRSSGKDIIGMGETIDYVLAFAPSKEKFEFNITIEYCSALDSSCNKKYITHYKFSNKDVGIVEIFDGYMT